MRRNIQLVWLLSSGPAEYRRQQRVQLVSVFQLVILTKIEFENVEIPGVDSVASAIGSCRASLEETSWTGGWALCAFAWSFSKNVLAEKSFGVSR